VANQLIAVDDINTGLLKWITPGSSTLDVINCNTINNTNDINTDTLDVTGTGTFNNIDVNGPVVCGVVQTDSVVTTNVSSAVITATTNLSTPEMRLPLGGQTLTIQPTNPAGDITLTLPNTVGNSGQVLSSDGVGNLNWQENTNGDQFELIKFTYQTNTGQNKGNSENIQKYFIPTPLNIVTGYMYKLEVQFKFARMTSGSLDTDFEFNYYSPNNLSITSYPYGAITHSFSSLYSTTYTPNQSFTHSVIFETSTNTTYQPNYTMKTGSGYSSGSNGDWTESYFCKITRIPLSAIP
jgi:hypothetical protein